MTQDWQGQSKARSFGVWRRERKTLRVSRVNLNLKVEQLQGKMTT